MEKSTYKVSEELKETFINKIEKIIKKGLKLEVKVSYHYVKEYFESISRNGKTITTKYFEYEVVGETPQIHGYEFIAVCEFLNDHNLINQNPFIKTEIPEKFKTYRECDHCQYKRNRKHTIILRNVETNEFISVGKACVKDFLGCDDPHNIALFLNAFGEFNENDFMSCSGPSYVSIEEILNYAVAVINKFGFISKRRADEEELTRTSSLVNFNIFPPMMMNSKQRKFLVEITDKDVEKAKTVFNWFKENKQDLNSNNNYIYNLSLLVDEKYVKDSKIAIITSLVNMYDREMNNIEIEKAKKEGKVSEWIGKEKERIDFEITLKSIYVTEGYYGLVVIYNMEDENGNKIVWKTNKNNLMEEGNSYTITGTIKDHSEWKSIKQTNITRVKIK